ncbi:hypothetical protein TNCT_684541 [Trichonephila clavata]|uniref:Uncharacterized protein n=1 Tax=Trichonephila clavata TaxID=2740835 RepID=A0A8X6KSL9_TRICU|nr:hypothetical protein TNCT_684541 [Trichonephila clavata]
MLGKLLRISSGLQTEVHPIASARCIVKSPCYGHCCQNYPRDYLLGSNMVNSGVNGDLASLRHALPTNPKSFWTFDIFS